MRVLNALCSFLRDGNRTMRLCVGLGCTTSITFFTYLRHVACKTKIKFRQNSGHRQPTLLPTHQTAVICSSHITMRFSQPAAGRLQSGTMADPAPSPPPAAPTNRRHHSNCGHSGHLLTGRSAANGPDLPIVSDGPAFG